MTKRSRLASPGLVLIVVTAAAVAMVAYVLGTQQSIETPAFTPQVMFADLKGQLDTVDRLVVQSNEEQFDIVKTAQGEWLIPQKANYPAASGKVREALLALSNLELIEPKTTKPERYPALGLGAPQDGGRGIEVIVLGGEKELARLIVGNQQQAATPGAPAQFYVRTPAADQTWAARGRLNVQPLAIDWIERAVLGIERNAIAALDLTPPEGPAYTLSRASPDESDVTLEGLPEGRDPSPAYTLNTSAFAPVGLMVEDVRPENEVDFNSDTHVTRAVFTTFGGVVLKLLLMADDETYWMKAEAGVAPLPVLPTEAQVSQQADDAIEDVAAAAAAEAQTTAVTLNRRLSGWVFAIPKYKYDQMTKLLEDMAEPLPE